MRLFHLYCCKNSLNSGAIRVIFTLSKQKIHHISLINKIKIVSKWEGQNFRQ